MVRYRRGRGRVLTLVTLYGGLVSAACNGGVGVKVHDIRTGPPLSTAQSCLGLRVLRMASLRRSSARLAYPVVALNPKEVHDYVTAAIGRCLVRV
jgi:hypothetical protein